MSDLTRTDIERVYPFDGHPHELDLNWRHDPVAALHLLLQQAEQAWEHADRQVGNDIELAGLCCKVARQRDAALARERRLREALEALGRHDAHRDPGMVSFIARSALADEPEPCDGGQDPDNCPKCGAHRASGTHCPPEKQPCPFDRADHWRIYAGNKPSPDLAPAQMVEWVDMDGVTLHQEPVSKVPWASKYMSGLRYRPLLDPDGLPYVSAEGLEPWAKYVAVDEDGEVWQFSLRPDTPTPDQCEWSQANEASGESRCTYAPATHAIPGDWRQSLARVWREEG